jgi:aspartate--ammonia ligase
MSKEYSINTNGYTSKLNLLETEKGIKLIKDNFERQLAKTLNLQRVSAPRFLATGNGLQDELDGSQIPVGFKTRFSDKTIEIVHSLAKWKRKAMKEYGFNNGLGLYTDMDAIRKDEEVSEIHSIYVDQWDWELIISKEDRNIEFLKKVVTKIYKAIRKTGKVVEKEFPVLQYRLPKNIHFVHAEELEARFPDHTSKERENLIAKEHGAVFIIGIGHALSSGIPHDARAADYDDWSTSTGENTHGLNGDIIVWDSVKNSALELSSMGIRVNSESLVNQLQILGQTEKSGLEYHQDIIHDRLPQTIGGGIGQSRLCMFLLQKFHIGEVQSSVWPDEMAGFCRENGIKLL